jgi:hypothetical protein
MKVIDKHENLKKQFFSLPEGDIFKFNNQYYMKTKAMFLYSDIDNLIDNDTIYDIEQVEEDCQIINAIRLNDFATHCSFDDDIYVEPLKAELHIV